MLSRIDTIELENAQLKEENEHLKEKMHNLVSSKNDLELKVEECKYDVRGACITSNNNEQYSRRTSVRVHGVQTVQNENTTELIVNMCTEKLGVALTTNDIEACHRLRAPRRNGEGPPRPPPIIVMLNRRQKRDEVIKNRRELKGSRVVISEDLTRLDQQTPNRVRVSERTNSTWSHNGQVMFTLPGDTWRYRIDPFQTIDEAIAMRNNNKQNIPRPPK